MEQVGASFTEFFEKVNNALQSLESGHSDAKSILDANAYLTDNLPKIESRLRNGENTQDIAKDLENDVKPHVDKLKRALHNLRRKGPRSTFLDIPSQRHGLNVEGLAEDNIKRFENLLSEVR